MNSKPLVGLVGWRGMVGSVLLSRMQEEKDFDLIEPMFFSTSNAGGKAPGHLVQNETTLQDAYDLKALSRCEIIITAQGGDYTSRIFEPLRQSGWKGHWIDAASTLRMHDDAVIILDPVNRKVIDEARQQSNRNWIGGNCTVSCMLMGLGALFQTGWVEWMSSMSYQAASGGGAQHMRELLKQFGKLHAAVEHHLDDPASAILEIDRTVLATQHLLDQSDTEHFGVPLAGSLIPWIDKDLGQGVSKEEWKAGVETNKILGRKVGDIIPIDGLCVRIGAMRSHSQALLFKLKEDIPLQDIENAIRTSNPWVRFVPNVREESVRQLTPVAVTGTLNIAVGRLRKTAMGPQYLSAFTVGDQLLWGAAEPLRRMLRILLPSG